MQRKPARVGVGRHRLAIVDEVDERDDIGFELGAHRLVGSQLLCGVPVADTEIETVDLAALILERVEDLASEGFLLGDAPAHGDQNRPRRRSAPRPGALAKDRWRAEAVLVGPHIHVHKLCMCIGAVTVANAGPIVTLLHFACVLPHLEFVEQPVVEIESREAFYGKEAGQRDADGQQDVGKKLSLHSSHSTNSFRIPRLLAASEIGQASLSWQGEAPRLFACQRARSGPLVGFHAAMMVSRRCLPPARPARRACSSWRPCGPCSIPRNAATP